MNEGDQVELFILKCASLKMAVDFVVGTQGTAAREAVEREQALSPFVAQFSAETRQNAAAMAEYYKLFHMLENDIRRLIDDTLTEERGANWWDTHAPEEVKKESDLNRKREQEAGVSSRSENPLDYITFGQLGEIIRHNWTLFGGILSNEKALGRVMFGLNVLRGPIAHCGLLAEDEVERLKLSVKDWFRLLEGPK